LGRSAEGAVAWAMRQRSVSHPRSSNRTCGFPASGSPTGFTVRHTEEITDRKRHRRACVLPSRLDQFSLKDRTANTKHKRRILLSSSRAEPTQQSRARAPYRSLQRPQILQHRRDELRHGWMNVYCSLQHRAGSLRIHDIEDTVDNLVT
jgi:hypothetical protein